MLTNKQAQLACPKCATGRTGSEFGRRISDDLYIEFCPRCSFIVSKLLGTHVGINIRAVVDWRAVNFYVNGFRSSDFDLMNPLVASIIEKGETWQNLAEIYDFME